MPFDGIQEPVQNSKSGDSDPDIPEASPEEKFIKSVRFILRFPNPKS